jgi:hypothetical protein
MKILKKIGLGLLGFIALLLIIAIFIPSTYTVSVSTTINKPQKEVFDYVKLIKNQEQYSVWILQEKNLELSYTGTDGSVGFIAHWTNKDNNIGEQEITKITAERIDVDLRFKKPMEGNQKAATIVTALSPTQTKVTNEFYGNDPYPFNLLSIIGKKFITDAQTQNMNNLKTILEK